MALERKISELTCEEAEDVALPVALVQQHHGAHGCDDVVHRQLRLQVFALQLVLGSTRVGDEDDARSKHREIGEEVAGIHKRSHQNDLRKHRADPSFVSNFQDRVKEKEKSCKMFD